MPFNHSSLTPKERELMRRGNLARRLVRNKGLDAELALWWVTAPDQEARDTANDLLERDSHTYPHRHTMPRRTQ